MMSDYYCQCHYYYHYDAVNYGAVLVAVTDISCCYQTVTTATSSSG